MNNEDLIEIVATDVMGWEVAVDLDAIEIYPALWKVLDHGPVTFWLVTYDDWDVWQEDADTWNPLQDDNDCMEAWDKFCKDEYTYFSYNPITGLWYAGQRYTCGTTVKNKDRRRAMVERMAKVAVKQ